jgi:uncharacterized membrane protein
MLYIALVPLEPHAPRYLVLFSPTLTYIYKTALDSDVVWERTHRLGGWLFVLTGLLGVIMSFVPALRLWGLMAVLLIVVVVLVVYCSNFP